MSTFFVLTESVRDRWAKKGSANPDIKVYIGALAGYGGSGYVDRNTLAGYIKHAQKTWSSFGGVMLWEASLAVGMAPFFIIEPRLLVHAMRIENDNYHKAVKNSLLRGGAASPSADGTASTPLHTPGHAQTSLSTPCTTPTPLYSKDAAPDPLPANSPPPASTSPCVDGAKWHRRSRFRNRSSNQI